MKQITPPDLSGKTSLVTGASRGIGRAISIALAKAGAHVLAVASTPGALEDVDDEIKNFGGTASLIPLDLTSGNAVEELSAATIERFPQVDILVLNAAILGELAPLADTDPKVWQKVMDLNVNVNWRMLRAFDQQLHAGDGSHVMFLTSRVGGEVARAYWGAYGISKAALEMLAKTYAEENKSRGVCVTTIDPGAMRTDMRALAMPGEDPQTLPEPERLSDMVYDLLQRAEPGWQRETFRDWSAS